MTGEARRRLPGLPPGGRAVLAAALASAALIAASFPPLALSPLAFVAWVPWMVAMRRVPGWRPAVASSILLWMTYHVAGCTWMVVVMVRHGGFAWPLAVFAYAVGAATLVPYGVATGLAASLAPRSGAAGLAALVAGWILTDLARARMVLGFPWLLPGMTQAACPGLLGVAELGGVHAVSLTVLGANAAIASVVLAWRAGWARRDLATAAAFAALAAAGMAWGLVRDAAFREADSGTRGSGRASRSVRLVLGPGEQSLKLDGVRPPWREGSLRAALVQGSVPQQVVMRSGAAEDEQRALLQLRLTDSALALGATSVVWSESAHPSTFDRMPMPLAVLRYRLAESQRALGLPAEVVVGGLADVPAPEVAPGEPPPPARVTNSALLVDAEGPSGRYDKRYLVPFGEYVPARWAFFWFERLARLVGDLLPGRSDEPLVGRHARYGAFICYEAVLPHHVRRVAGRGADVLVNVTNDGWFHGSSAPEQHLRFSAVRAVETRRWVLRCANSGISAAFGPDGRMAGRLEEGERGVLLVAADRRRPGTETPYVRFGDAPAAIACALVLAAAAAAARHDARR